PLHPALPNRVAAGPVRLRRGRPDQPGRHLRGALDRLVLVGDAVRPQLVGGALDPRRHPLLRRVLGGGLEHLQDVRLLRLVVYGGAGDHRRGLVLRHPVVRTPRAHRLGGLWIAINWYYVWTITMGWGAWVVPGF